MASAEDLAQDFWSALCQHDVARAASLLADGAIFHPAGMPPAGGDAGIESYLAAIGSDIGSPLETIALYEHMVIVERVGHIAGEPAGRLRVIVSLARVRDGHITSWQDFFDPTAYATSADTAHARPEMGEASQAAAR